MANTTGTDSFMPPSQTVSTATNFTVSLWVYPTYVTDTVNYHGRFLFRRQNASGYGHGIYLHSSTAKPTTELKVSAGSVSATGTNAWTAGAWNHLVYTVDSSNNWAFYLNGAANGSGTYTSGYRFTEASGDTFYYIRPSSWWTMMEGTHDELRLMEEVVSASWVTAEYNNGNSPATFYAVGNETGTSGTRRGRAVVIGE